MYVLFFLTLFLYVALFLSRYPVESVATMRAIIEAAEVWQNHNSKILGNNLFDILCAEQVRSHCPSLTRSTLV